MFAAAMMFACPNLELSIYSTCKRISQKLLRNIVKFLEIIYDELHIQPHKVLRKNSEEVHIEGDEGRGDVRIVNSYPSKIGGCLFWCQGIYSVCAVNCKARSVSRASRVCKVAWRGRASGM
jgi:hypothetical protein